MCRTHGCMNVHGVYRCIDAHMHAQADTLYMPHALRYQRSRANVVSCTNAYRYNRASRELQRTLLNPKLRAKTVSLPMCTPTDEHCERNTRASIPCSMSSSTSSGD